MNHLRHVLDPDELENENFVGDDTWSQYDGDEIYSDYTIDGPNVTVTDWYEPGIGKVEDVSGTPVVKYYHDNLIGTTRFMTDASGNKIESAVYTAFGELVSGDPRRFAYAGAWGYQTDLVPGSTPPTSDMRFLHVGHRYYDPSIGRFLQRDPIGIGGGLNAYVYVRNSPAVTVDPRGLRTDMGWDEPPGGYPRAKPVPPKPPKVSCSIEEMQREKENLDIIVNACIWGIFTAAGGAILAPTGAAVAGAAVGAATGAGAAATSTAYGQGRL